MLGCTSGLFGHWQQLVDEPVDSLDAWSCRYLERLAELEVAVADAICGDCLVHFDVRSDNVIFSSAGPEHDVVVDWPGASGGASWIDLVGLLPALELDGGPTQRRCSRATPWAELPTQTQSQPSSHRSLATSPGCRSWTHHPECQKSARSRLRKVGSPAV